MCVSSWPAAQERTGRSPSLACSACHSDLRRSRARAQRFEAGAHPARAECSPPNARRGADWEHYGLPVPIRVVLADDNYIARQGIEQVLASAAGIEVISR